MVSFADVGPNAPRDDSPSLFQATFDGCLVAAALPRELVESWLPAGLGLTLMPAAPGATSHPLLAVIGDHRRGAVEVASRIASGPVLYQESALVVPGVVQPGESGCFSVPIAMVCGYRVATWVGNDFYGYPKEPGQISWHPRGVAVESAGASVLGVELHGRRPTSVGSAQRILGWLQGPVRSRHAAGPLVCSQWQFGSAAAEWWRVDATLEVRRPPVPGAQPASATCLPGCAFLVRGMSWGLSAPRRLATTH